MNILKHPGWHRAVSFWQWVDVALAEGSPPGAAPLSHQAHSRTNGE